MTVINQDGLVFRDLDHDGVLAPYEDWRLPPQVRARDLLGRMTLAEKAGLMMHGTVPAVGPMGLLGIGPVYDLERASRQILEVGITSMITRLSLAPGELAAQNNALQAIAARGRLGIPLLVSTDPRSHFKATTGASVAAAGFSQWPETLGLAAIGDEDLVRRFADIIRQEYRAVGIHMALSPQADLSTSPRWARIEGTFGEDPALVSRMVGAYVEGIQGGRQGLNPTGVAAVVKHWVGYGASRDGWDGHNYYGRFSAFPGGAFQAHIDAFAGAFSAEVSGVMPTYNILQGARVNGQPTEPVGGGFSRLLLTDLLRESLGFEGVILSDWAITKDCNEVCKTGVPEQKLSDIGMSWGVEDLSPLERYILGVEAGLDQFGGEEDPAPLLEAVAAGRLSEARIEASALRILVQRFELGLFDNPFVDEADAARLVGCSDFTAEAEAAQRRALTWLSGEMTATLTASDRIYVHGFDPAALTARGLTVTGDLSEATVGLVRMTAPWQTLHPTYFFGRMQHEGDLDFKPDHPDFLALQRIAAAVPVMVSVHLDRPAILAPVKDMARLLLAEFGASEAAVLDVMTGLARPEGHLPFSLPASMDAVLAQSPDVPMDDPAPLFPIRHGL